MYISKLISPLFLFIYISVAVFIIVGGQPTTGIDNDNDDPLANTVAMLQAELEKLAARNEKLEKTVEEIARREDTTLKNSVWPFLLNTMHYDVENVNNYFIGTSGVTYIRWGRRTCEDNGAKLLYRGYAAGRPYREGGSGSNQLCLPEEPQWKNHTSDNTPTGSLYGIVYRIHGAHTTFFSGVNNGGSTDFHNKPARCAACYVPQRSAALMIPARTSCPVGWTQEYTGYIMSEHATPGRLSSNYICVDGEPEVASDPSNLDQAILLFVKVGCGTLPCSTYHHGWELACVVCSK